MHVLFNHQETFPKNCGLFPDEHGERSHQELLKMEFSYRSKNVLNALADYAWKNIKY